MSSFQFSPSEIPITAGEITAILKCPVYIAAGQFIRCFCFLYHATDGPITPSNLTAGIYTGTTISGANPIRTLNPKQWGRAGLGSYVFEDYVASSVAPGIYTIVFNGTYAGNSFQILFPVRVVQ